ncbi:MAG TPA: hypothetical protein IGS52_11065 [Oscillatoriaceae cyanobacterium M33_DOE_052]|uniref:Uncharacterized protein n=1 Tax=Planktothricoides sp. SpSt-374 TaxID=2282167 RepID=A0A7C3VN68_9CYAN|nr:hypothetical protein [Oscillatoriaceae cyanobacterium M33_DOE_052]
MLRTYKALIRGSHIEWQEEAPNLEDGSVAVHITILQEDSIISPAQRRQKMVEALAKLAAINAFADIDPMQWQRQVRQDRSLPDRES